MTIASAPGRQALPGIYRSNVAHSSNFILEPIPFTNMHFCRVDGHVVVTRPSKQNFGDMKADKSMAYHGNVSTAPISNWLWISPELPSFILALGYPQVKAGPVSHF